MNSRMRGLYAITPDTLAGEALLDRVRAALAGGIGALQYRSKSTDAQRRREDALALAQLCRECGVTFIVNDDLELALAVDADGVHLGRDDGDLRAARARLGKKLLGASCYDSYELAVEAVQAGADHVAFGSVFPSPTKPHAARAPLSLFARARELGVPLVAIGGINLENAADVIAAGAHSLAVISDLFEAPDIAKRARGYAALFASRFATGA